MPETTTSDEKPLDPGAPRRITLPSGKIVEVRSHRTLLGCDIAEALASQPGGAWMKNVVAMRNALIASMATELDPGRRSTTPLDGTIEAVLAQQPDDYRVLFNAVDDAFALVLGVSVVPDIDEYADPKAPTTDTADSRPESGADSPQ